MRSDNLEDHIFWSKQPVSDTKTKLGDEINEPVNSEISSSEISKTPITLPEGFEWCTLGLKDPYILKELYRFLRENYIEDSSLVFKLEYSEETLALVQPGYFPECIIGIRQKETGELVATIAATPDELTIRGKTIRIMLVDFLCVQQKLRSKRISPVLIKEITRLSNLRGIFQALHTGAIVLPTCISAPM
ncbi:hypothetical protein HZS_824 [Henneguya salminicola]|nr:hypothetical protein HZS_824 [Henneguya salminicola]